VFELAGFVVVALGVGSLEKKAFNLVGRVERVLVLLVQAVGVTFQHSANVGRVRRPALVDDFTENQNLAGPEHIRGSPIESRPVDAQPQITLALRRETANRGT